MATKPNIATLLREFADQIEATEQAKPESDGPRLVSVARAAARLGLSPRSTYEMIDAGQIPHLRGGAGSKRILVDLHDVDAWIEANKRRGAA